MSGAPMTRAKAVEAAMERAAQSPIETSYSELVAELAYDAGRLAEARHIAKLAQQIEGEWLPTGVQAAIRARARELARKSKGGRG